MVAAGAPGWFGDGPPDRDGGEVREDFVVDVVGEGGECVHSSRSGCGSSGICLCVG